MLDVAEVERLAVLGALLAQAGAAFYWGGGLHRIVKEHERRHGGHDTRFIAQGNQLLDHEGRIGGLEGSGIERRQRHR